MRVPKVGAVDPRRQRPCVESVYDDRPSRITVFDDAPMKAECQRMIELRSLERFVRQGLSSDLERLSEWSSLCDGSEDYNAVVADDDR